MKRLWVVLAAALVASPARAAHWAVDTAKSRLVFSVMWSGEPLHGEFHKWKADIDFDPADLARSHVAAVIDTASLSTDYQDGDDGIKGALGFAVDRFPEAQFVTTAFHTGPSGTYIADAKLTIRGISRSITLPFKLDIRGNRAHATGKTTIIRTDFGVGQGEWQTAQPVAHEVTVTLDLWALKD
ncbi:MAG: YceI family protein [Alphaproteobacteria bacterium]|nr:YceI family protein [Alphaproteobacteria bacterium]